MNGHVIQLINHRMSDKERNREYFANYMNNFTSTPLALAVSTIFFPSTRIVEGHVILDIPSVQYDITELEESIKSNKNSADLEGVIDSYNWVEVYHLFGHFDDNRDLSADDYDEFLGRIEKKLCDIVKRSWFLWLNDTYKDRKFETFIIPSSETGSVLGVGFRQT